MSIEEQFKQWCDAMNKFRKGRITLSNMLYDYNEGRIDAKTFDAFKRTIATAWKKRSINDYPDDVMEKIVSTSTIKGDHKYYCKGPKLHAGIDQCSRIMDVRDFHKNNLDFASTGFEINGPLTDQQINDLQTLGLKNIACGLMRTRKPFAWITKSAELENTLVNCSTGESKAMEVWRCLGMRHFQDDQRIIEIKYPPDAFPDGELRAPTFFDGCPSIYYRSRKSADGWGRAVHMESHQDGLPEAIHSTIPFTESFSVKDIGPLPPMPSFDHAAFETSFDYFWPY